MARGLEYNQQGHQITWQCKLCGKWHGIDDIYYFGKEVVDDQHKPIYICESCRDDYWNWMKEECKKIYANPGITDENQSLS